MNAAAYLDGQAAADAVLAYAEALDARDWGAFRALFTPGIRLDYGSIGSVVGAISADEWTSRCRALEGFASTAHRLHNIRATVDGDRATVTSIVDAAHFVEVSGEMCMGDLIGRYTHHLLRENGWKIAGVDLAVTAYPAGKAAFDAVFAAARAKHAARASHSERQAR
ncbi:nuclear transport factor 2 family protein [Sandaracinobacteroides hominis]|uniref:nuclear transport factor 2 family protein n=1 Tax=Sandaracinobacteroides hominis TaxID=2780086 RepID=UPI0018F555AF|nr:nuclear transport factor 2 family protein [Sandaracinobacteroides hominis]